MRDFLRYKKLILQSPLCVLRIYFWLLLAFYQAQSRIFLSGLLEEKGEYEKAIQEVTSLEGNASEDLKPALLLTKGRLQLLKNSKDEAKATFTTIIDKYASSNEAQKARSFRGLLN